MKMLITGGAGFIGANLAEFVLAKDAGHSIVVLDDFSTGREDNLDGLDIELVRGSVVDPDAVDRAASGVDAIVHLGALGSVPRSVADPMTSHASNLTGTLHVMETARREGAYVVFASSSSVYGSNPKLPKSEFDWTRPMSPYAVTKLGAEGYVLAYQFAYGLPTLAFRFFNVYGPKQAADQAYAAVIPKFLDAALSGETIEVHGDGLQSRDFTYVDTVCAALYDAVVNRVVVPDPVNLAFGTNTTLIDLIEQIRLHVDEDLEVSHVEPRLGDVRASMSDGERIRELFPSLKPVELKVGLEKTVDWFRSNGA